VTSGSGALSAHLREQIALTVGQANECGYCIAAHSAIGQKVGLSMAELAQARHGLAADHKGTEALSFARKLVDQRGRVTDADVDHVRRAGYSDGEINEIVANVALSIFTNYFNHGAETEIDFPTAPNP
jgi:AhpD family alkylhydroperoxidase